MKMREPGEQLGWSERQVEEAEVEYKRYLTLCLRYPYPQHSIVPNKIMDTMWHYHIMDTKAYHKDCKRVFGHYFHHFPYFGLRGEDDAANLRNFLRCNQDVLSRNLWRNIDHSSAAGTVGMIARIAAGTRVPRQRRKATMD